ncbi:MAG: exodeoxyribonuclease VII large subunit [Acholeplasmatales bacterium]|jgi:exodeoxyribonuclease VII large subunit|nr:exodeoxyribonuclease VII large subunit [Acholeplasmatales bacterium]
MDKILSVSQINSSIKEALNTEAFTNIIIEGEISNFKNHQTGNLYFALKDALSQINANMWSSYVRLLQFSPKDGDKVICYGSVSVYEKGGSYAFNVYKMEVKGEGDLFKRYQETLKYYEQKGYYEARYKISIPKYPTSIGLITSATGAVIQDFIRTINRRYRLCEVVLYPAIVQGPDCPLSVSSCIKKANLDKRCNVLLVGRGGGSFEDLFGFNDSLIIEAIHDSVIPIITCIGHGTDKSIADYVADLEAPTPTAAAELATPDSLNLIKALGNVEETIRRNLKNKIESLQNEVSNNINLLEALSPSAQILSCQTKNESLTVTLQNLLKNYLATKSDLVLKYASNIEALNPQAILARGYSLVYQGDHILNSIKNLKVSEDVRVKLSDGTIKTTIKEIKGE